MSLPCILIEKEPPIGWLIFNRPDRLNAFNLESWEGIPSAVAELESDPEIRVVILRGAGEKAFAAGADITEFEEHRRDPETARRYAEMNEAAYLAIRLCSKPTVAMIRGFCVGGGCAVALNADIRIAARDAQFALTPARLGLGYAYSGIEHAVRELGPAATRYLFLTASYLKADQALGLGLIQEIHEPNELREKAVYLGRVISSNAPRTLKAIKASVLESVRDPGDRRPEEVERLLRDCFESEDYQEGLRAFAEKRKPRFTGR